MLTNKFSNMSKQKKSLMQLYPGSFYIPIIIFGNLVLLGFGISIPVLQTEKLVFWKDTYTIVTGVQNLLTGGNVFLGIIILLFSIVFPISKLGTLLIVWFKKLISEKRNKILKWLDILGRWSMLDVFVVAVFIVISKVGGLVDAKPRTGVYIFAGAVFMSMILFQVVTHLARKATNQSK